MPPPGSALISPSRTRCRHGVAPHGATPLYEEPLRTKSLFRCPHTNEAKTLEFALGVIVGGIATAIAIVIFA